MIRIRPGGENFLPGVGRAVSAAPPETPPGKVLLRRNTAALLSRTACSAEQVFRSPYRLDIPPIIPQTSPCIFSTGLLSQLDLGS